MAFGQQPFGFSFGSASQSGLGQTPQQSVFTGFSIPKEFRQASPAHPPGDVPEAKDCGQDESSYAEFVSAFVSLFDRQQNCDVKFSVGQTIIGAHKIFLLPRSEVLYEKAKDWKASDAPIVINEVSPNTFNSVLRFIYSNQVKITNDNVFKLFFAAKTFKMAGLEARCTRYISGSINKENMCFYLEQALEFDATAFQNVCRDVFAKETADIIGKAEFLNLSQPALSFLLDAEEVVVLEIEIFTAVQKWMTEQCKKLRLPEDGTHMRQVIGDALFKIRFPTMTTHDFSNQVTTIDGLLTNEEMLQIYRKISVLGPKKEAVVCPFSSVFRCSKCNGNVRDKLYNVLVQNSVDLFAVHKIKGGIQGAEYSINNRHQLALQCFSDLIKSEAKTWQSTDQNQTAAINQALQEWHTQASSSGNLKTIITKTEALQEIILNSE